MSQDDPFDPSQTSRTIIRPTPGRRRQAQQAPQSKPAGQATGQSGHADQTQTNFTATGIFELPNLGHDISVNRLASAALNVMTISTLLRQSSHHPDPEKLFVDIAEEINQFQNQALDAGVSRDDVTVARYLLCTFIDENVLSTPWGCESVWTARSLLSHFHNEGWGGENFFIILNRLQEVPRDKIQLLEFAYLLLSLGFQGRYRVQPNGQRELEQIRQDLFRIIRSTQGDYERSLSPKWKGVEKKESPLNRYLPVWAAGVVSLLLLLLVYTVLLFSLNSVSDPVASAIASLGNKFPEYESPVYQRPRSAKTLAKLLTAEINNGQLAVKISKGREVVVLSGDSFFASGKDTIKEGSEYLVVRVAEALSQLEGQVIVDGHSDNVPIRSLRFPSNWALSKARAEAVASILGNDIGVDRIKAVNGKADTVPIKPNNSRKNKALNRRVEIMLIGV